MRVVTRRLAVPGTILALLTLAISASAAVVPAARAAGNVWTLGYNGNGLLGNGGYSDSAIAVQVSGLRGVTAVAGGAYHMLALKNDGTVWAWGDNSYGQLGNGSNAGSNTPVQVRGLTGVIAIAAGQWHSVAVRYDGTLWAWGDNSNGQLGDGGAETSSNLPIQVDIAAITAVTCDSLGTFALLSDGTVWAWGDNSYGQLGNNSIVPSNIPLQIATLSGITTISAGAYHVLALDASGTVWGWGYNYYGSLGNGAGTTSMVPVKVPGIAGIRSIAAGEYHSLAVAKDGSVWAFGYNGDGEVGVGTFDTAYTPTRVLFLANVTAVFASYENSFAVGSDGTVWGWGSNSNGQLGMSSDRYQSAIPLQIGSLSGIVAMSSTYVSVAAVQSQSAAVNWGAGASGQLGNGGNSDSAAAVAAIGISTLSLRSVKAAAGGELHSLVLNSDGTLAAFGYNNDGELGIGSAGAPLLQPASVVAPSGVGRLSNVMTVAAGRNHSLAVSSDGSVLAWGLNGSGQLGNGTTTPSSVPASVPGVSGAVAVAGGGAHSVALQSDGTVWAWGDGTSGQLGNAGNSVSLTPVQVLGPGAAGVLLDVKAIAAGGAHTLALLSGGVVYAWGSNSNGQLGTGNPGASNTPVQVVGVGGSGFLSGIVAIAAGKSHSLALRNDGAVLAWGEGGFGELGNGNIVDSPVPVQVLGSGGSGFLTGIVAIAAGDGAGSAHSLALGSDGRVWAWGSNSNGQLGVVGAGSVATPVQVNLVAPAALAAGGYHSMALAVPASLTNVVDHFLVDVSTTALPAGAPFTVSVIAQDAANDTVTTYAGTIHFTLANPDAGATIPADYTFTAGDNGTRVFSNAFALVSSGLQQIYAIDVQQPAVSGSSITVSVTPVVAVTVSPASALLAVGGTQQFSATVSGAGDTTVTWAVNGITGGNTTVGTVSPAGLYTAPAAPVTVALSATANADPTRSATAVATSTTAVQTLRTPLAWGYNSDGELGLGYFSVNSCNCVRSPVEMATITGVIAITAGNQFGLALKSDGTVWAWGYGGYGTLGNGGTGTSNTPVPVSGLTGAVAVAGGYQHALAVKSDGTAWAWGYDGNGELGNGAYSGSVLAPVPVSNLSAVIAVSAGNSHSLALRGDGTVWSFGYNGEGELGDATRSSSNVPVQVRGISQATGIAAGGYHSLALRVDGTVWGWGYNANGEVGNGVFSSGGCNCVAYPVQVSALTGVVAVAAGYQHSLALKSDGTVWAWGYGYDGELGDGNSTRSSVPVQVSGLSGVVAIAAGENHSLALKSDGTVWAWGYGYYGQVGTGIAFDATTPVQVPTVSGIAAIGAGGYSSFALVASQPFVDLAANAGGDSVINFDPLASTLSNYNPVPPNYGSNGPVTVSYVTEGAGTGGADLPYIDWWGIGYGDFNSAGFAATSGYLADVILSAAPGATLTLNSFDLAGYYSDYSGETVQILADGNVVQDYSPYTVLGSSAPYHSSFAPAVSGNVVKIRWGTQWNVGINHVHFSSPPPSLVALGATVTLSPAVVNSNPVFSATGVTLSYAVPAGLSLLSVNSSSMNCSPGSTVVCTQAVVPANSTAAAVITLQANTLGTYINTVNVTANEVDGAPANNTSSVNFQVTNTGTAADLEVIAAGTPASQGGALAFSATVVNHGPAPASNVVFSDNLDRYGFVAAAATQGGTCSFAAGNVTCPIGSLNVGASATVTVAVTPPLSGWAANYFHAVASETDLNPLNNSAHVGRTESLANTSTGLAIEVAAGGGSSVSFDLVTQPGMTTVNVAPFAGLVPAGFRVGTPSLLYDVVTSATYAGTIRVTLPFNPAMFHHPAKVRIFHLEGSTWVDRTLAVSAGTITAVTTSLSPFLILEPLN
ncbi:MAG TPA: hypothetical protein VFU76_14010, partial [Terriglobales bacterium]|nr:hypothetical protein [Terriglobales bacterium]